MILIIMTKKYILWTPVARYWHFLILFLFPSPTPTLPPLLTLPPFNFFPPLQSFPSKNREVKGKNGFMQSPPPPLSLSSTSLLLNTIRNSMKIVAPTLLMNLLVYSPLFSLLLRIRGLLRVSPLLYILLCLMFLSEKLNLESILRVM